MADIDIKEVLQQQLELLRERTKLNLDLDELCNVNREILATVSALVALDCFGDC